MIHHLLDSSEDLSRRAAELVIDELKQKKNLLLGAATGSTPSGLYSRLAEAAETTPGLFSAIRIMKLDEWLGLSMDDPATCETYIRTHLLQPLKISDDRYLTFHSNPISPTAECRAINDMFDTHGPIDVCILGIGVNGHIAFNEPAGSLTPHAHIATLTQSSQHHPMVAGRGGNPPTSGLTLGMTDIFRSRMILLLISGSAKKAITRDLLSQNITTALPASLLWLHPNAICLIDREAYP